MKLQRYFAVSLFGAMVLFLGASQHAFAGPDLPGLEWVDPPSLIFEANFTGNQSAGIWPASWWSSIHRYHVYDLGGPITPAPGVSGIELIPEPVNGSNGGWGLFGGENGGTGASGADTMIRFNSPFGISTQSGWGILAGSGGGAGGNGGSIPVGIWPVGGNGGTGGNGGAVNVTSNGPIHVANAFMESGIAALSTGGDGGNGGSANVGVGAEGGDGRAGGYGGNVTVANYGSIQIDPGTLPVLSIGPQGIWAVSAGGDGGNGGSANVGGGSIGGAGGLGRDSGTVTVNNEGDITTSGDLSNGIDAKSFGGKGGKGGSAVVGGGAVGGDAGAGGNGGNVTVNNQASITTSGDSSRGISALSQGGAGGDGGPGTVGAYAEGGDGGKGGSAGAVTINNAGSIATTGNKADGIVGLSLGGAGGDGGTAGGVAGQGGGARGSGPGGSVQVYNDGDIATSGLDSRGILAQSVGGFAGSVGTGAGVVGWGGSGNSAGNGGTVGVRNNGMITVTGGSAETGVDKELVSAAILAQSIGGGGGDAASSYGLVALGGKGSAGGSGNTVNVENNGRLQTSGSDTSGILAQSVGGGGGAGGASYGLGAVGGAGNSTGDGGAVYVTNTGVVTTAGNGSAGILAESVGGGGGVVAGHGGNTYSPIFTMGGSGGSGGNGGTVSVQNSGNLETSGVSSSGIFAQSVGGGGGTGGAAYDVGLMFALALGGKSTLGGDGKQVDVSSTGASILTTGDFSHGIQAQSLGGGGGSGGDVRTLVLGLAFSENLAVGGSAGGGDDGGVVNLTSGSTIVTQGAQAHGLHAQSLGGGGGSGGSSTTWTINVPVPELPAFTSGVTLGGKGGDGGTGNVATVNNTGDISTSGFRSYGILAQSVGGGGGEGGNSEAGTLAINSMVMTTSIGGAGGKGGAGDAVVVDNQGDLTTAGDYAYGIIAQSIGGGGGAGGSSTSLVADTELVMSLEDLVPSGDFMANMSIGGSSDGGGGGAAVDVGNTGNIVTEGSFASGILAQSIGGGGGAGGDSKEIQIEISGNPLDSLGFFGALSSTSELSVGGRGGAGGDAGAVTIHNSGTLTTAGDFAHGILAQSIGGGGGVGGDSTQISVTFLEMPTEFDFAFMPTTSSLILGGSGGEGGKGGDLAVHNSGDIVTQGHFANGILAQSIGGGGGVNGSTTVKSFGPMSGLQSSMSLRGNNSGVGDGGAVIVENSANLTTHGGFAHGILAQSIGGGGGFAGISEDTGSSTLDFSSETAILLQNMGFGVGFAGSVGGSGNAGPVSVTHTGSITTFGDASHGILAQSVTGHGTAGPVSVTLHSDIIAHGVNSDGIHAQSMGDYGNGNISINNGGTVRGGSGTGAGVNIDGGANNTLTNAAGGSISALSGRAIVGSSGSDTIINYGTVAGAVELGGGINGFHNNLGARFDTGLTIGLGAGNTLTNEGILSPGGLGTILNTTLIGNFVQSDLGILEIDVGGFATGSFDSLTITGTATGGMGLLPVGGNIHFSFLQGYDIFADLDPGQSKALQFLNVEGNPDFLSTSLFSYDFFGGPSGFEFNVFQMDEGLYLEASNVVPIPGAFLLGFLGLGVAGWRLRKPVSESARASKVAESL